MKKLICVLIVCILSFANSIYALGDGGILDGDSGVTVQSLKEVEIAEKKKAAALEISQILLNEGQVRLSDEEAQNKVESYIAEYAPNSTFKYKGSGAKNANSYTCLNYTCYTQPNSYFCGPTSAYILLRGMGYSGFTINDLADDLNTDESGTAFPGTWVNTLDTRSGIPRFVAAWNPGSQYTNYAYVAIGVGQHGFVNDVHMTASSPTLPGYNASSTYWHYITADGIDLDNSRIRYLDSSNAQSGRYGEHWVGISTMQTLVADRGIIF